jgi:hypothetical protein
MGLTTESLKGIIFSWVSLHLRRSQHTAEGSSSLRIQLPARRGHPFTSSTCFSIGHSDFWTSDIKRKSTAGLSRHGRSGDSGNRYGTDMFTADGYSEFSTSAVRF